MCGISGIVDLKNSLSKNLIEDYLNKFNKILHHRGPNNSGTYIKNQIGLAQTRLSIIDLSLNGKQPMISQNQKNIISYNGEVYNFKELKKKLPDIKYKSNTDTEIVLEYLTKFDHKKFMNDANGMYAISFYNSADDTLLFLRDKLGKKPLYYYHDENYIIWGSEMNIFFESPIKHKLEIDPQAIRNYFDVGYVPAPISIFKGIKKVLPGEVIKIDLKRNKLEKYNFKIINKYKILSDEEFETTLYDAIKIRTISDVPYGVFLSSGVDSSLVASILQSTKTNKIDTFSIGVKDTDYDESFNAKKIASSIGTNHNELIINENDLIDAVPHMSKIYGEPFADSSQIPTFILSKFAKESITVALSGDGGDEIFCGYNRYLIAYKYKILINFLFLINRFKFSYKFLLKISEKINLSFVNKENLHKVHSISKIFNFKDYYERMILLSGESNNKIFKKNLDDYDKSYLKFYQNEKIDDITSMQIYDLLNYMPDDILTKVDRASMANSLEVRCPLLDYRLTNSILLDKESKMKSSLGKHRLRKVLKKYLDLNLLSSKKKGFGIPVGKWLSNGLKNFSDEVFNSNYLKNDLFLDHKEIQILWDNHKKGNHINSNLLWSILIYINWKANNKIL